LIVFVFTVVSPEWLLTIIVNRNVQAHYQLVMGLFC